MASSVQSLEWTTSPQAECSSFDSVKILDRNSKDEWNTNWYHCEIWGVKIRAFWSHGVRLSILMRHATAESQQQSDHPAIVFFRGPTVATTVKWPPSRFKHHQPPAKRPASRASLKSPQAIGVLPCNVLACHERLNCKRM